MVLTDDGHDGVDRMRVVASRFRQAVGAGVAPVDDATTLRTRARMSANLSDLDPGGHGVVRQM